MALSSKLRFGCLAGVSLAWGFQPEPNIVREKSFWRQSVSGSERVSRANKVRIEAHGTVIVKGGDGDLVSYVLIKRVKAKNESEARRLLERGAVRAMTYRDFTVLKVLSSFGTTELNVTAPRLSREIQIATRGGNVEAYDLDHALVAETGCGRMRVDRIGGSVTAATAGGDITMGKIGGAVRCISAGGPIRANYIGGEAFFETAGGDIVVQEVRGPVRASTAGGGIRIGRAGGPVTVSTAGGPIDVGEALGLVTAKNSAGPIQVGAAAGVRCESASGAIRLSNVSGSLRASTAFGNIVARINAGPLTDSFLTTGAGDITVYVPSNLAVTIRAHMEAMGNLHKIISDFPGIVVRSQGSLVEAEGALNGGGPVIQLAGSSGTIYIRRQSR
jgi:DUF4097 and DUF4098 domain-containing protein YvlB